MYCEYYFLLYNSIVERSGAIPMARSDGLYYPKQFDSDSQDSNASEKSSGKFFEEKRPATQRKKIKSKSNHYSFQGYFPTPRQRNMGDFGRRQ